MVIRSWVRLLKNVCNEGNKGLRLAMKACIPGDSECGDSLVTDSLVTDSECGDSLVTDSECGDSSVTDSDCFEGKAVCRVVADFVCVCFKAVCGVVTDSVCKEGKAGSDSLESDGCMHGFPRRHGLAKAHQAWTAWTKMAADWISATPVLSLMVRRPVATSK